MLEARRGQRRRHGALDRRCDSLLVCVMCRAHNESRAPPTSCTREGEHEGTRAARRALQARDELRASKSRLPRKLFTSANVSFGDKFLRALRSRCESDLSRTHISSKETRPSGKYETIISKIFLKGYCLSERCATYVVFRLVFLRGRNRLSLVMFTGHW